MITKIRSLINNFSNSLSEIEKLTRENYWANVYRSATMGTDWVSNIPLNIGRWAANYSMLYILFRVLNDIKPLKVMEMGLGETTKIFDAYKRKLNTNAECITVEHDSSWINLRKNSFSKEITIVELELENKIIEDVPSVYYKNLCENIHVANNKFNLIVVDGPFGSDSYSRYNIVELINNDFLDENFVIIMDDYERTGEKETVEAIKRSLRKKGIKYCLGTYAGDKQQCIIVSECYSFLTSL